MPYSAHFNATIANPHSPLYNPALDPNNYLHYLPNKGANYLFLILFSLVTITLTYYIVKTWRYTATILIVLVGTGGEIIGYCMRIVLIYAPDGPQGIFILEYLCVVLCPLAIAAALYIIAGRLVTFILQWKPLFGSQLGDGVTRMPTGGRPSKRWHRIVIWLVSHFGPIFISSDIFTFLVQAAGGSLLLSKSNTLINDGRNILLAGLALQLASFTLFCAILATVLIQFQKTPSDSSLVVNNSITSLHPALPGTLLTLGFASLMILIRSAFRLAEYTQGFDGYLAVTEPFFLCLDATPVFLSVMVWCWWSKEGSRLDINSPSSTPEKHLDSAQATTTTWKKWTMGVGWPTWVFAATGGRKGRKKAPKFSTMPDEGFDGTTPGSSTPPLQGSGSLLPSSAQDAPNSRHSVEHTAESGGDSASTIVQ